MDGWQVALLWSDALDEMGKVMATLLLLELGVPVF